MPPRLSTIGAIGEGTIGLSERALSGYRSYRTTIGLLSESTIGLSDRGSNKSQKVIRHKQAPRSQEGGARGAPLGSSRGPLITGIRRSGLGDVEGIRLGRISRVRSSEVGFTRGTKSEKARPVDPA